MEREEKMDGVGEEPESDAGCCSKEDKGLPTQESKKLKDHQKEKEKGISEEIAPVCESCGWKLDRERPLQDRDDWLSRQVREKKKCADCYLVDFMGASCTISSKQQQNEKKRNR